MTAMVETIAVSAFSVGVTQLFKKAGVPGNWLILVCVLAGSFATYMTQFQPELWEQVSLILTALTSTGLVSFADERLKKLQPQQ